MAKASFTGMVGETIKLELDFARELELKWRGGYSVVLGEYVRPSIPNGFAYECTTAGQTAANEPEWPTVIDETVYDGSVDWTCKSAIDGGADSISTQSVTADAGLTVDFDAIDGTRVDVTITLGSVGVYDLFCEVGTSAGETLKQTVSVVVKQ